MAASCDDQTSVNLASKDLHSVMDLSQDLDFQHASRFIASLSERMTRKLQAYVRTNLHVASQEILASNMAGLESLERRTRLRISASTMHHSDQVEQLKDQLNDLRREICQLIKKEGAKQEFLVAQILEEVGELNKWIREAFTKGTLVVGSPKNVLDEEVSESGNQVQNPGNDFKHNPVETRQIGSSNKVENCPEVGCGLSMRDKSSALLLQSQNSSFCHQMCNPIWKQLNTGAGDETKAVRAEDTEGRAVKTLSSSNKIQAQAVDQDIVLPLDAEGSTHAFSCIQCQEEMMFYAKEPDGPHLCKHVTFNGDDEKMIKSDKPYHLNPAANALETEELDIKQCTLRTFSFTESHSGSQATAGKVEAYGTREIQHKGWFVVAKRRIRRNYMMSSKSQKVCTVNLMSDKITGKKSRFLPIKERRSFRQPACHFTHPDIERLVTGVEKLGTGRWRDIKEAYFSVEKHRSAANLKDKWRSLIHSAKLAPEKQRSVKLPSLLVKRILDIDEGEKLAHLRRPAAASYCSGGQ